jgi:hypothetical protein
MNYSCIVLIDEEEIIPTLLDVPNKTHVYLYFVYAHSNHTVAIISSKALYLYNEILDKYAKLQADFYDLDLAYHGFLVNYTHLLESYGMLNASYVQHLLDYAKLQESNAALLLEHAQNIRNLSYVFIVTTTFFIIVAFYLSTHAHRKDLKS